MSATEGVSDVLRSAAVREYFRWHLGDAGWAGAYERVWADPVAALTVLAEDQGDFSNKAAKILADEVML